MASPGLHKAMSRSVVLILMLLAAAFAGCSEKPAKPAPEDTAPESQYQSDVLNLSAPVMPREPRTTTEMNLTHAPEWRLGEWWTYEMTDGFTGQSYVFTRIVAGEDRFAGNYLVGFPADQFSNDVMLFHIPGYGDIAKANLAYETHDAYFQPLDFPLTDGKVWEAEFEGTGTGPASVAAVTGTEATIDLQLGSNYHGTAIYDATIGEIRSLLMMQGANLYASYNVTGHGYDYEGLVRVPHAHDLVFIHGRVAGVVSAGGGGGPVSTPTETVVVQPGYDRLSFIIAVGGGALLAPIPTAGVFRETVTAPDGTKYEATWTPADIPTSGFLKIIAIGHELPEGTWTMEHVAAGVGVAFVEGIGYHSIDIDLPSGCVVASVNAQHHAADCRTTVQDAGQGSYGNSTTAKRAT